MGLASCTGPALPPAWRAYRDGFVVLQHLATLCGAAGGPVAWSRLAVWLGFDERESEAVLRNLLETGCVESRDGGRTVALTPVGREYLDGGRGRRLSVRPTVADRAAA